MSKFNRDDIKSFIENFDSSEVDSAGPKLLQEECGCAEPEYVSSDSMDTAHSLFSTPDIYEIFEPMQYKLADAAPCPESYNKTSQAVLQDPNKVIEMLKPAMLELGVGCPASLAKAVADILKMTQETGATPVFKLV